MRYHALAGVLSVLLATLAGAQTAPGDLLLVTEADFLSALDAAHSAVGLRREAVGTAGAAAVAASTFADPSVGVAYENPSGDVRQVDLFLSWQLPDPARRLQVEAAQRGLEAAEAGFAGDLLALRSTLRRVYAEWALAAARVDLLALHADRLTTLARRQEARAEGGESSGLEARRLALAAGEATSRLALERARLETARAAARAWRPELPAGAVPELPPLAPPRQARGLHPRLAAAEAELAQRQLDRRAADRVLAAPQVQAGWQRQEAGGESIAGPILGLSWSLPAVDRKRAQRALAEVRLRAAEARLETLRRELAAQAEGAATAYRHLATAAAEAGHTRDENGAMVAAAVAAFRLGEATLTDLLETLAAVTDAELTALQLRAAALAAHRDLERLTGGAPGPHSATDDPENPTRGETP